MLQQFRNSIWNYFFKDCWNIGFVTDWDNPFSHPQKLRVKWLSHNYIEGWFADPFLLDVSEEYYEVLVEEFNYSTQKGRIDLLTIDRNNCKLVNLKVLLEKPSHLSFPAIIKEGNNIYVCPENSEENGLIIYKFDSKKKELHPIKKLISDPIVDAIYYKINESHYILATKDAEMLDNKKLIIYKSDNLLGNYSQVETICMDGFYARSAGNIFKIDNKFIRPSQIYEGCYGRGILFSEIEMNSSFCSNEIMRIYSDDPLYDLGYHTFNMLENIIVVDGHRFQRPFLAKFYFSLRRIFQKDYQL